ncbi:MAG: IS66 family transposase [Myxococcales bacterium]|nr:IS66 family transposase [Myxococcales bacterium]
MAPGDIDSLDHGGVKALSLALFEQNRSLVEQNKALAQRVAELEARLNVPPKTPDNSSLPPSSARKPNRPDRMSRRRKGRPGVARALCESPDVVRDVYAKRCTNCKSAATPEHQTNVHAYDHIDLPPMKAVVTRVNLHSGSCMCCGKRIAAEPPADMAPGSPFGPGIVAFVVYMHARHMVSYERLREMLKGLVGLDVSEGAIANMLARTASPFAAVADGIKQEVRAAPVIASDETSARVEGKTHWQWVFGCATAVYHIIVPSRGKAVVTDFLDGKRPDVWISDRLAAQCGHAPAHQFCLAHLIRDAQFAIDNGDNVFAPGLKALFKHACAIGRRRKDLSDRALKVRLRHLERRLDALLALAPKKAAGIKLAAAIRHARPHLLVFMRRRDVEATNNQSEQRLRGSVIFRKVTNGFRSGWGARVYADICSIVATGRLAGRTALDVIRDALAGRRLPAPA